MLGILAEIPSQAKVSKLKRPDIETFRDFSKNELDGPVPIKEGADSTIYDLAKALEILCDYTVIVESEAEKYRLALEELTPGGSEFYKNPKRCISYIQDRFEFGHKAKVEAVRLRRVIEKFRDYLICDMGGDGRTLKCSACGYVGYSATERHEEECPFNEV